MPPPARPRAHGVTARRTARLTDLDRRTLTIIQATFPLARRPYAELGRRLDLSERSAYRRVQSLRRRGIIRRIGGVVNSPRLGLVGTLAALKVPAERIDEVALIVNAIPNVTHNYLREHEYNMWFTVTARSREEVVAILERVRRETGRADLLDLPSIRTYKINVQLDFGIQEGKGDSPLFRKEHRKRGQSPPSPPTAVGGNVLALLQGDLPPGLEPYGALAARAGLTTADFLAAARDLLDRRQLRRVSALLNHRRAGFAANAMCVWQVEPDRVDQAGECIAAFPEVTHCYRRPTSAAWPYALYSMVHARTRAECDAVARRIAEAVRPIAYRLLFSTRELKKQSLPPAGLP